MRRGNTWPRRALVICIPASVCASGCDRDGGDAVANVTVTPATAESPATNRAFATPFVGHVAARETLGPVVVARVSYTIDARRIRREKTDHRDVVTEHVARTSPRSGVIIDLSRDRAILYATYLDHRVAVEMTLSEFDRHVQSVRESRIQREPYGTAFMPLRGQPTVRTTNERSATRIDGVPCDVLRIEPPPAAYEVHHALGIVVDRALVERVEPGIPQQVAGFPLRVYTLSTTVVAATGPASAGPSRMGQIVDSARRATTRAANALNAKLDAISIDVTTPDAGAFDVPEGFERCKDLTDFIRRTGGEGGGGIDLD